MEHNELAAKAEAFLFSEGGAISARKLSQLLGIKPAELSPVLDELEERLTGDGISLVRTADEVALVVSQSASDAVVDAYERELEKEIGDAGLEVLAIVLYRGNSTRAQIDYIRGVNTSSTLRHLIARGLLQRIPNPDDSREYLYRPTTELLAHIGVHKATELPDYDKISGELAAFEEQQNLFAQTNGSEDTESAPAGE